MNLMEKIRGLRDKSQRSNMWKTEIMGKEAAYIQETVIKPEQMYKFHELRKVCRFKVLKEVRLINEKTHIHTNTCLRPVW